ncbi:MAG: hypothetical protein EOP21_01045 [Hyphomicrobiales bacterium]|nr:MAG: hypothetical protein EOP21_01045 [Hyphomicrobiales bacterium]
MLDDNRETALPSRRIHPVRRALRPVYERIGELNEAAAFLVAFSERNSDLPSLTSALVFNRARIAETSSLFETAVSGLPDKYRSDTRVADVALALDRITKAFDQVESQIARRGEG